MTTKKKMKFLPVGPILDRKDLKEKEVIAALIAAAEMVRQPFDFMQDLREYREWLEHTYDGLSDEKKALMSADAIVYLEDMLNETAPPFCRFTGPDQTHPSWGVWPNEEQLYDGERDGEVKRTHDQIDMKAYKAAGMRIPSYNLVVNDHGNMTLYQKVAAGRGYKWKEVWSVV